MDLFNKIQDQKEEEILFTDEQIKQELFREKENAKICCLVYGADGTGKTGIVFDYLTNDDVKQGFKLVCIDLDGGAQHLKHYHKQKKDSLLVIDPIETVETEEGTEIDYKKTFAKIRAIIRWVKNNHEKEKIKAIVFDGLSTALTYAEQQMRLDKHIDVDGGVQTRFWMKRNKLFRETLDQIKGIPISKFFIAHENFIMDDKEVSKIVSTTNAMMIQKIKCVRKDNFDKVVFTATIDKNKYNVKSEGAKFNFCEVDKNVKEVKWNVKEIFEIIGGD